MDPVLGRFISEDPAKDGQNWFVYCNSNPCDFVDKTGKTWLNHVFGDDAFGEEVYLYLEELVAQLQSGEISFEEAQQQSADWLDGVFKGTMKLGIGDNAEIAGRYQLLMDAPDWAEDAFIRG